MNLAGVRSAQPVPASPRPPRAAHRPAAARAPRTTPGCTPRPRRGARLGPPNRYSAARATRTGGHPADMALTTVKVGNAGSYIAPAAQRLARPELALALAQAEPLD